MSIKARQFDTLADGKSVTAYDLLNENGLQVTILDFGATVANIYVPDRNGRRDDIVLGCDRVADYLVSPHFGGVIGRYANRIRNGHFVLEGKSCQLSVNDGKHHLHGGFEGFDHKLWTVASVDGNHNRLSLRYHSADGEEGYPGAAEIEVCYTLTADSLCIEYAARADRDTIINLTNHSYFNLQGHASGSIDGHYLSLYADSYTEADDELIPTGRILSVADSPYDFRESRRIADGMEQGRGFAPMQSPAYLGGYDTNYVLRHSDGKMGLAAEVYEEASGRRMKVFTDQPGIQLYTGNSLLDVRGKDGAQYNKRDAFCLETQHYPDSPNHPDWPSVVLRPEEPFFSETRFQFLID